jgi:hypothetical protein
VNVEVGVEAQRGDKSPPTEDTVASLVHDLSTAPGEVGAVLRANQSQFRGPDRMWRTTLGLTKCSPVLPGTGTPSIIIKAWKRC